MLRKWLKIFSFAIGSAVGLVSTSVVADEGLVVLEDPQTQRSLVGIGTSTPSQSLHVVDGTFEGPQIRVQSTSEETKGRRLLQLENGDGNAIFSIKSNGMEWVFTNSRDPAGNQVFTINHVGNPGNEIRINPNGDTRVTGTFEANGLVGPGYAYACIDPNGVIVRKEIPCDQIQ